MKTEKLADFLGDWLPGITSGELDQLVLMLEAVRQQCLKRPTASGLVELIPKWQRERALERGCNETCCWFPK